MAMDLDELLNGVKNGTVSVDKAKAISRYWGQLSRRKSGPNM